MNFRTQDKLCGVLVFIIAIPFGVYNLYTAIYKGYTRPGMIMLAVTMSIMSIALIIFLHRAPDVLCAARVFRKARLYTP